MLIWLNYFTIAFTPEVKVSGFAAVSTCEYICYHFVVKWVLELIVSKEWWRAAKRRVVQLNKMTRSKCVRKIEAQIWWINAVCILSGISRKNDSLFLARISITTCFALIYDYLICVFLMCMLANTFLLNVCSQVEFLLLHLVWCLGPEQ